MDSRKKLSKKTNIGFFSSFSPGYEMLKFAQSKGTIKFIASSKSDNSKYKRKIEDISLKNKIKLFQDVEDKKNEFVHFLETQKIDLIFLCWWNEIIPEKLINKARVGWVNLHPSYLPHGRGKHQYFWSIVDGIPFGVTLHPIDKGIDTEPILFQKKIKVEFEDTGETLYKKSVLEGINLFKKYFLKILNLDFKIKYQNKNTHTYHNSKDVLNKSTISGSDEFKAVDLINLIRAKMFEFGPSLIIKTKIRSII